MILVFFVVEGAVTFLDNSMFLLVWLVVLVVFANGFEFGVSSWRFWMDVGGRGGSSEEDMIAYVDLVL